MITSYRNGILFIITAVLIALFTMLTGNRMILIFVLIILLILEIVIVARNTREVQGIMDLLKKGKLQAYAQQKQRLCKPISKQQRIAQVQWDTLERLLGDGDCDPAELMKALSWQPTNTKRQKSLYARGLAILGLVLVTREDYDTLSDYEAEIQELCKAPFVSNPQLSYQIYWMLRILLMCLTYHNEPTTAHLTQLQDLFEHELPCYARMCYSYIVAKMARGQDPLWARQILYDIAQYGQELYVCKQASALAHEFEGRAYHDSL